MLYFHAKIKVFTLYFVLLKMCQVEFVKISGSTTVSHISDNSIFSNSNLHRTNASLVYVWWHIQSINSANKLFFSCNKFSSVRQKHILFSELFLAPASFSIRVVQEMVFFSKLGKNYEKAIFHHKNPWLVSEHVHIKMWHASIKFPFYFMLKGPIKCKIANIRMFYVC